MGSPARTRLAVNLGGGVGPAFRFGRVQVAGYGIVRVHIENDDPNNDMNNDDVSSHTVVLPGVHMAVGSDVGPFPHGTQARELELI